MAVPYTFGNATTSIPLSQLDNNFATPITIGNTITNLTGITNIASGTSLTIGSNGNTTALTVATTGIVTFNSTGAVTVPVGTTGQQPTGATGMLRFNTTTTSFEGYNGTAWAAVGGGATGGGTDQIFWQNGQTVNSSYSIPANINAGTFGPVTIAANATVTIPSSSTWTVV